MRLEFNHNTEVSIDVLLNKITIKCYIIKKNERTYNMYSGQLF
jgi:hypothetical protein